VSTSVACLLLRLLQCVLNEARHCWSIGDSELLLSMPTSTARVIRSDFTKNPMPPRGRSGLALASGNAGPRKLSTSRRNLQRNLEKSRSKCEATPAA
jgi:hypothetical protein